MKTIVSIPHHEYPAAVRDLVERKLQQIAKYYERIESLRAVLTREADDHRVELVATVGHGVTLVVDCRENLLVVDVNPNPDISPDSGAALQAGAAGMGYTGFIEAILELALEDR